jgi:DNA repair protein RadC
MVTAQPGPHLCSLSEQHCKPPKALYGHRAQNEWENITFTAIPRVAEPSQADELISKHLKDALAHLGVRLLDHCSG